MNSQGKNETAAVQELLEEIRGLMQLKGENPFKVRAFEKAAQSLAEYKDLPARARAGTLTEIPGIGKGISEVLTEFLLNGTSRARDELKASMPEGVLELTQVPGLGPKKAMQLIEELGIHTLGELEYACRENRLLKLKGFGLKVQQKVLDGLQFIAASAGKLRLDDALAEASPVLQAVRLVVGEAQVCETGELRRRCEIVEQLSLLIERPLEDKAARALEKRVNAALEKSARSRWSVHWALAREWGYELARTTGTEAHWRALGGPLPFDAETEEAFYERVGVPFVPPEARETGEEVELARAGKLTRLLATGGVKGVFHNHTTRSDGAATLEEMVVAARDLGYEYIGISDHSQSAFYAQGLMPQTLVEQEREIRKVQEKHPEIRVFWGIESDILQDGSLDYEDKVLRRFDFVVASVHSRFKMDREAMTERLLQAVRNPHTRFLGHVTGRLLLGRKGYELDMERVIAEAARHDVAIEINSHPARLDIDWRWGPELRRCKTSVAVNPDAHEVSGLQDTRYGEWMARKALLPQELVINSRDVKGVERWLKRA